MPELVLQGGVSDRYWVLASMIFPDDVDLRRAYHANLVAVGETQGHDPNETVAIPRWLLGHLLDAPSHTDLLTRVKENTKRGYVAGDFLGTLFAMDSFPKATEFQRPSFGKALEVALTRASTTSFGDGSRLPASKATLRKYIAQYKGVAHFWAALRLHETFPSKFGHRQLLETPEGLQFFLGIAATLQDFAASFRPKGARIGETTLEFDADTAWTVPASTPRLIPPWKSPPEPLLEILRGYQRKR